MVKISLRNYHDEVTVEPYEGPMVGEQCYRAYIVIGAVEHSIQRSHPEHARIALLEGLTQEGYIHG